MQGDAQPGKDEDIAVEDCDIDMVDAEEENIQGAGMESEDAGKEDFEEVDSNIMDDDWQLPDDIP